MCGIVFQDKAFIFTDGMKELKRTQAEREARARGALTAKTVNDKLDYGSIPATGWKHGSYGNKIEKAQQIISEKKSALKLVSEEAFMEALALTPSTGCGEIDAKIAVIKYKFIAKEGSFDSDALNDYFELLDNGEDSFVSVYIDEAYIYNDLFEEKYDNDEGLLVVKARIVKVLPLDFKTQIIVDNITIGFEGINGVDGSIDWYERKEGTLSYINL